MNSRRYEKPGGEPGLVYHDDKSLMIFQTTQIRMGRAMSIAMEPKITPKV